jgi:hypothetical protein
LATAPHTTYIQTQHAQNPVGVLELTESFSAREKEQFAVWPGDERRWFGSSGYREISPLSLLLFVIGGRPWHKVTSVSHPERLSAAWLAVRKTESTELRLCRSDELPVLY